MMHVELSQLTDHNRKKLAYGMQQSEAGRKQLAAMKEARAKLPALFTEMGSTFRLPKPDYERFMRDADIAKAKENSTDE